jgi:predicted ester cyclase
VSNNHAPRAERAPVATNWRLKPGLSRAEPVVHAKGDGAFDYRQATADRAVALILLGALALMSWGTFGSAGESTAELARPHSLIIDGSLPKAQVDAQILAARRYDTFWGTGNEALARAALAPDFTDRTLPAGRPQGLAGPLAASKLMHAAIPDLRCEIDQMIVAGDRVVVHLHFRGAFTGRFEHVQGRGQAIDFVATDIYRVANGRIAENWHIEDTLTLLQQLDLVGRSRDPQ